MNNKFKKISVFLIQLILLLFISTNSYAFNGGSLIPLMTSDTAPSGIADSSNSPASAWRCFDGSSSTTYQTTTGVTAAWISYTFPTSKVINKYILSNDASTAYTPKTWTFEAYNGTSWVVLDSQANITWSANENKVFNYTNSISYTSYRLNVSAANNTTFRIGELEVYNVDTIAPSTPTGLSVSEISKTSLNVTWDNNVDPDLSHYEVFRNGISIGTPTTNSFLDNNCSIGVAYNYQVKAIDGSNNMSALSNGVSYTIQPSPPGIVSDLAYSNLSANGLTLSWSALTSNVTSYNIYVNGTLIGNTVGVDYAITGLTADTIYSIQVSGMNGTQEGTLSSPLSVRTLTTNIDLPVLSGSTSLITSDGVTINWTPLIDTTGIDGIKIFINGELIGNVLPTESSYLITGLLPNTSYTVVLKTYNSFGESLPSNDIIFTTSNTSGGSTTDSTIGLYAGTIGGLPIDITWTGFANGFTQLFNNLNGLLIMLLAISIAMMGSRNVVGWFKNGLKGVR